MEVDRRGWRVVAGYRLDSLTDEEKGLIVEMYRRGDRPTDIAVLFMKSRTAIWKVLKSAGVATHKGEGGGCRVRVVCEYCGVEFEKTRSRVRVANSRRHFCRDEHYFEWLRVTGGEYRPSRQGQRAGRRMVMECMGVGGLPEGSVVHHEDGSCWNNEPENLVLFANQGDHVKWHRGLRDEVEPLWVGSGSKEGRGEWEE